MWEAISASVTTAERSRPHIFARSSLRFLAPQALRKRHLEPHVVASETGEAWLEADSVNGIA